MFREMFSNCDCGVSVIIWPLGIHIAALDDIIGEM